jgi:hypothetical protein
MHTTTSYEQQTYNIMMTQPSSSSLSAANKTAAKNHRSEEERGQKA